MLLVRVLSLAILGGGVILSTSVQAAPLQICLDKNFNAPFVYAEKIKGAGQLRGYSLELIKIIMEKTQTPYAIKSLTQTDIDSKIQNKNPNAGCDIILDVNKNVSHDNYLMLTNPIYSLHYDLVYNWESYMTGLGIKSLSEANKFKVCGVKNVDYGAVSKALNIQALNSIKDAVFNIKTKECEVFVAESVSMRYGQRANQYQVPPVGCVRLAGTEKAYHIGVAKHVVGAATVVASMQKALLESAKEMASLAEEYDINPTTCQQTLNIN
ncbi:MAG: transporter substrate-binding domain-containing protein [Moraxellaceae bacterium]|nr:transporter substrate-binding domain-containing protein [Moraxellaceae bacterium]